MFAILRECNDKVVYACVLPGRSSSRECAVWRHLPCAEVGHRCSSRKVVQSKFYAQRAVQGSLIT